MAAENPLRILLLALLAALSISSAFALSETPFLVAHKNAVPKKLESGSEIVSVTIDIYNRGLSTAYDLSLTDDTWSLDVFDVVTGNTSKSWEALNGDAHASHSFELEPKVKTVYYGAPALVTFRTPTKSKLQEAYSTPILALETLADKVIINKYQLAKKMLATYGSQISVILFVGAFAHMIFNPSKTRAGNVNKKKH